MTLIQDSPYITTAVNACRFSDKLELCGLAQMNFAGLHAVASERSADIKRHGDNPEYYEFCWYLRETGERVLQLN